MDFACPRTFVKTTTPIYISRQFSIRMQRPTNLPHCILKLNNRKNINLQTTTQFSNFGSLLFDTLLHGLCNDVRKFCKEMQLNNSKEISGIIFSFTSEKSNKYFDYIIKPKDSWQRNQIALELFRKPSRIPQELRKNFNEVCIQS